MEVVIFFTYYKQFLIFCFLENPRGDLEIQGGILESRGDFENQYFGWNIQSKIENPNIPSEILIFKIPPLDFQNPTKFIGGFQNPGVHFENPKGILRNSTFC